MASSSVILTGPGACAADRCGKREASRRIADSSPARWRRPGLLARWNMVLGPKRFLLYIRKLIAFAGKPYVERGQQKDTQDQVGDEASNDHDCEWTLRVGTK